MSKDLAVKQNELSVIEQILMQGDLSKLTPLHRVTYYNKVCESMGLNPYTRPFDYISLNGKLTLYAKKDATEQLRQVKKISIISLEGKIVDDLYIVVAKASTPDGRLDQSTGAVSVGNLKGEAKANAIMKAETKAKRRVTLSISGMGWTDESEIESIPNAKRVNVDMQTGEMIEIENVQPPVQAQEVVKAEPQSVLVAPRIDNPIQQEVFQPKEYDAKFLEFIEKHQLGHDHSAKSLYVKHIAEKSNMPISKVIDYAMLNEQVFMDKFVAWADMQVPKSSES